MATKKEQTEERKKTIQEIVVGLLQKELMTAKQLKEQTTQKYVSVSKESEQSAKSRVGTVLKDMEEKSLIMKDEGGKYALKARIAMPPAPEKVETKAKTAKAKTKKVTQKNPVEEKKVETGKEPETEKTALPPVEEKAEEEKPAPKKRGRKPKAATEPAAETKVEENVTEKTEVKEEAPPKKRGRKPKAKPLEEVRTESKEAEKVSEPKEAPKAQEKKEEPKVEKEEKEEKKEEKEEKEEKVEKIQPITPPVELPATPPAPVEEKKELPQKAENKQLIVKPKAEIAQKDLVHDLTSIFVGSTKAAPAATAERKEFAKTESKPQARVEAKPEAKQAPTSATKAEKTSVVEKKQTATPPASSTKGEPKKENKTDKSVKQTPSKGQRNSGRSAQQEKQLTAEEKLRDSFLKRIRTLGGDYFEYYSVYLLERYCMKNGRRLEGLRISGGDHDGGIDGEIELTDKFGFKETIYIQSKNWDPEKGKKDDWIVGETLVQQFIGACACRQAKDGKQRCRGIFVTTSYFHPDAQRILNDMSEQFVGYDGKDLFEAAKECKFGVIEKNGEWVLDEKLLSGEKAFFQML